MPTRITCCTHYTRRRRLSRGIFFTRIYCETQRRCVDVTRTKRYEERRSEALTLKKNCGVLEECADYGATTTTTRRSTTTARISLTLSHYTLCLSLSRAVGDTIYAAAATAMQTHTRYCTISTLSLSLARTHTLGLEAAAAGWLPSAVSLWLLA